MARVNAKHELREQMRRSLDVLPRSEFSVASKAICAELEAAVPENGVVLVFLPDEREPDIDPFVGAMIAAGGLVAAPRCDWDAGTFEAVGVKSLTAVEIRRHGVREPVGGVVPSEITAVLVPGLAFDCAGGRLGRGGGFYDRFLAGLPRGVRRIGVCFSAQIVDRVPRESHDASVDEIVTENGRVFLDRSSA